MKTTFVTSISVLILLASQSASAQVLKRTCVTDAYGSRTCTEIRRIVKTDRIMGMSAKKYIRGLRRGKCMPSPSGACGGE